MLLAEKLDCVTSVKGQHRNRSVRFAESVNESIEKNANVQFSKLMVENANVVGKLKFSF